MGSQGMPCAAGMDIRTAIDGNNGNQTEGLDEDRARPDEAD
ncbi:hypothetical protein [Paenibacillus residui]|uniref:Uncharacterized protein n=1 Tax=Paenibacillus residui TaxID=629724 RepID=A0ABW3DEY7_9BACL